MSQEKLIGENKEAAIEEQAEDNDSNSHKLLTHCPYCKGKVVKRGIRKTDTPKVATKNYH